jgi:hypothetical protein
MRLSEANFYAKISVAAVLLGVLGANSVTERSFAAPADEHAVLVDNIGTYGRKISTKSPIAQKFFDRGLRLAELSHLGTSDLVKCFGISRG